MKIAFRISKMAHGGAERVFLSVAEVLKRDFHAEIDFIVDKLGQGETEAIVLSKKFQLHGLASNRTLSSINPLKRYIDDYKPDVLISGYTDTNMAAIISSMLAKHKCKVIVSEHATLKEHWQYNSFKRKILLNCYVKYGYRFADHILAVSKGLSSSIEKMGHAANKVSFIYNPVRFNALSIKKDKVKNEIPTILAVGRITRPKDYLTLLQAFNLLSQKYDARLVIVGVIADISEKVKLDEYLTLNNLTSRVEFVGFTENVQHYYAAADVFVLSSAWEGFGNVIVEALAFGLPIVSTDCNYGPAEILEDGKYGRLVPVGDWKALSLALEDTVNKKNIIDADILKNRSLIFSEKNIANEYWKLIQKIK